MIVRDYPTRLRDFQERIETISADEADDIQRVVQVLKSILARSRAKSGHFRAYVHVKTNGYAQGEFVYNPNASMFSSVCGNGDTARRRRAATAQRRAISLVHKLFTM